MTRNRLQRESLVRRALALADAEGLRAVSFRRLAMELGVTPMALYRHVRDQTDLIDAMADLLLSEIVLPPLDSQDWNGSLRSVLRSAGQTFAAHPSAVALLRSGTGTTPNSFRLTDSLLGILISAGCTPAEALLIVQLFSTLMLTEPLVFAEHLGPHLFSEGAVPDETSHHDDPATPANVQPLPAAFLESYPYLATILPQAGTWADAEHAREFGLALFLAGIEAMLARKRTGAAKSTSGP